MLKILTIFTIFSTVIYASYNPFFTTEKAPKKESNQVKQVIVKEVVKRKAIPSRKNAEITYFGFVQSSKGKYALIKFDDKNIVIKKNDSLYIADQIYKVKKITSNYILLKDKYSRSQSVYFSSDIDQKYNK